MRATASAIVLIFLTTSISAREADRIAFPSDYREWVFLSSGLGMTYGPVAAESQDQNPKFDNVFVTRSAYRDFLKSGRWPEKTMFVLEVRSSATTGSINRGGHFQSGDAAIQAEVKERGQWTFYKFESAGAEGKAWPRTASCYACHSEHAASDNTFVQFYPTLLPIAKEKGTLKSSRAE